MSEPIAFLEQYASRKGFRYNADADERWVRAWEPYATLRTPFRYAHTIEATGEEGSFTLAQLATVGPAGERTAWIAIVQDVRIAVKSAGTSDRGSGFGEPLELVTMPRRRTGSEAFDRMFASFVPEGIDVARAITPSLRKLLLGWAIPLHFELRAGGFVLAPVNLRFDVESLSWLVRSLAIFGEKAAKQPTPG